MSICGCSEVPHYNFTVLLTNSKCMLRSTSSVPALVRIFMIVAEQPYWCELGSFPPYYCLNEFSCRLMHVRQVPWIWGGCIRIPTYVAFVNENINLPRPFSTRNFCSAYHSVPNYHAPVGNRLLVYGWQCHSIEERYLTKVQVGNVVL